MSYDCCRTHARTGKRPAGRPGGGCVCMRAIMLGVLGGPRIRFAVDTEELLGTHASQLASAARSNVYRYYFADWGCKS